MKDWAVVIGEWWSPYSRRWETSDYPTLTYDNCTPEYALEEAIKEWSKDFDDTSEFTECRIRYYVFDPQRVWEAYPTAPNWLRPQDHIEGVLRFNFPKHIRQKLGEMTLTKDPTSHKG